MKNKVYVRLVPITTLAIALLLMSVAAAAPTASDFSKSAYKNNAITFSLTDFQSHMSAATGESTAITSIKLVSLPSAPGATFALNETPISAGQEISAAEIDYVLFIPALDWTGSTTVSYQVKTDSDYSNTATITLDITEPPANPLHAESLSITTQKNTPVQGQLSGVSQNNKPFVFKLLNQPVKGSVTLNESTGEFVYMPFKDQLGDDNFSFTIKDEDFESDPGLVTVTIEGIAPTPTPTGFYYSDMLGHWGEYSAIKLAQKDALIGEQIDDRYYFYPDKQMTRADFLLLVNSAVGKENLPDPDPQFKFSDDNIIPSWLKLPAYKAYAAGIIKGSEQPDGSVKLDPFRQINRIETITLLSNAMNPAVQNNEDLVFTDENSIPAWSVQAVKNAEGYGLIKGYDDNTLRPFKNVSKAEAAEMVYQLMKYFGKFPDATTDMNNLK